MVAFGERLVVSNIIAVIPVNKRQTLNWLDCLTDDQIAKKLPRSVLADVTRRGNLKQVTLTVKHIFLKKKGGMYVQKLQSMVERSKKHSYMKYNRYRVILKIS